MGNDKSFYTLLNKYNTLLAQTQDLKEQLDKKRAIKNSIRLYIKTKKWIKPYPKCQSKV